jgi:hypothetical protein
LRGIRTLYATLRPLAGRRIVTLADDQHDLRANLCQGNVERGEDAGRQCLLIAEQTEQQVLRPDVVMAQSPGLVLCEDDDLACSLTELLEDAASVAALRA